MQYILERHRWLVAVGAVLIQLALGAIYSWSVYTDYLEATPYSFQSSEVMAVFAAGLAVFAVTMVYAGRKMASIGAQRLTLLAGLVLGIGYIGAGLWGGTFWGQFIGIGLVGGAGIGLGYVVPIAISKRWFPDKEGLVTGIGVAGFGFGALIWIKLANSWFAGGLIEQTSILGLHGVQSTFLIYGVAFALLVWVGSLFMVNPPAGWVPDGYHTKAKEQETQHQFTTGEMLRTGTFYRMTTVFFFSALAGLMVIGALKLMGKDLLLLRGFSPGDAKDAAINAAAWLAIANGIGRIVWGALSDKFGTTRSMVAMVLLQSVALVAVYHIFVMYFDDGGLIGVASIIGFMFGGNFALMPTWTSDMFGQKHFAANYGPVFLAYAPAGIVGPMLAGVFRDVIGGPTVWMYVHIIAAALCVIAAIIAAGVRAPQPRHTLEPATQSA